MISSEMIILVSAVFVFSTILIGWFYLSCRALLRHAKSTEQLGDDIDYSEDLPAISVIVYASNDAENLANFLPALLSQDYPQFEVIVVNDSSTDSSKDVVSGMMLDYRNLYQTFVPYDTCNLSRKKLSITLGLKAAKHDIVVCTSANCTSVSNQWLKMMARNFTPGTDIVIGYSHIDYSAKMRFIAYDSVMSAVQYLNYAVSGKTYRGDGNNLAYRKQLFFDNKGFSKSLNLHFGDDDLFINEVATADNTRVEISPESQLTCHFNNLKSSYNELKLRYDFTARYLRTSAMAVWATASMVYYVFHLLVVTGVAFYYDNVIVMPAIITLWLLVVIIQIVYHRKCATVLQAPKSSILIPLFALIRPIVNLKYKFKSYSNRKSNYTWQRRK